MKRCDILLLLCGLLFFAACSGGVIGIEENGVIKIIDGVRVFQNSDKPSVEELVIAPREVFRLKGMEEEAIEDKEREFAWPRGLDIDSCGNIYVLDFSTASVKKFSKDGIFIKSFGGFGNGPGEVKRPFMIAVLNDVVFVPSYWMNRMVTFDTEGNFLGNIPVKGKYPISLERVGSDRFIGYVSHRYRVKKAVYWRFNLVLMDAEFNVLHTLRRYIVTYDRSYNHYQDCYTAYAVGKDKIFVAQDSKEKYRINVFDFNGRLLHAIEKSYQKVEFNQKELDELNNTLWLINKRDGRRTFIPIKSRYKKTINHMFCDNEGRLLVNASIKRDDSNHYDFWVDVFRDGKFLRKVRLDIFRGYDFIKVHDEKIFFKGGRIFHLDEQEALVKVFEY